MEDKILFVMGNGPSLGDVMNNPMKLNFIKKHDTFGLNAAYRAFKKYNFYPTYFGCFDYLVNESHKDAFEKLVFENNTIKEFYFIGNGILKQNLFKEHVRNNKRFKKFNFKHIPIDTYTGISKNYSDYYNPGSSGANALQIGIMKGYKKIVLLGCDCNYVEKIEGASSYDKNSSHRLVMTKNVDNNPNYWFSEYQKKGDKFNLPGTSKFQMGSWKNIAKHSPKTIKIYNASKISKIPYFEKIDFQTLM
jgi:hypothetical protein